MQHRLIHKIGHLMVDNVGGWEQLDAHDAGKRLQLDAGVCFETVEMDATPVIAAVLDACEALLGAGARKVLAGVLPEIRTIPLSALRDCHSTKWNRPGSKSCSTA